MSDKDYLTKTLTGTALSRRSFLKWSAALGGAAALTGGAGYGLKLLDTAAEAAQASDQGKWIPADCWADCGSKGFNKVYVVNGTVIRQGTDETHPDSPDYPRLRSCARGRAQRQQVFGADRVKYPMKRKNWEPGGGKKELRGRDEWVRISWEEALDLIAGELIRVKANYGNESILLPGYVTSLFGQWDVGRMLALWGGYMENWGACSSGAWGKGGPVVGLEERLNDRFDLRKSDLIVLWGSNPAWSRAGLPTFNLLQMKKAGAKFICVDPFRNPTAQVLADEWIPIRPATDTALVLGMAHTLITEDNPDINPLINWDFLNSCTVGFDSEHMPEGADPKENFKDYVLGTYDGNPKTAEWASEICGVPAHTIRTFAREVATTNKVAISMSPAPARTTNGDSWPQAVMTLGAMTGHIGKSGSMIGSDGGHTWEKEAYTLVVGGNILGEPAFFMPGVKEWITNPIGGTSGMYNRPLDPYKRINNNEMWSSILTGKYTAGEGDIRECNIQMIWNVHSNHLNQAPGVLKGIEAFRKVEFVLTQNFVMTTSAKYSDIVLPITTQWERYGELSMGYRENLLWFSQVTEPLFEAKDDIWVAVELAKRIGVDPKVVEPFPLKQEVFNQAAASIVVTEDGKTFEPLLTITEQDIKDFGVEGKPQQGRIPIKQLKEQGIYTVPRSPDDNYGYVHLEAFRNDPEANPVATPSGKLEIYSQAKVDLVNSCGWTKIDPLPVYKPALEGYEDTFSDWENKVKGEFPLQLISVHILRHTHSTFANVPSLREAFPHPLYMNSMDASARGLKTGDTVLVTSRHGKVLRPVLITDVLMPGVTAMGQGAWVEIDEETGIDLSGSVNVLIGDNPVGQGHQAYNSCIVQVEKWSGTPLTPDEKWAQRIVF